MTDTRKKLLEEKPLRLMLHLSVPAIVGMVVIGLYSFMDAVFVGKMIGESAMGAISVAYPFTLINTGIATLLGVGSASVLSRAIGRKDAETVNKIMGNLGALVLILSLTVTVIGIAFTRQIISITGAEGEILDYSVRYMRIIFLGSLFVNFAQSANMIMRGEGLMTKAMTFMGIGAVLNIVLDPIFIKAFGENGIEGAAVATVAAQVTQAVITLVYFLTKSKTVRFHGIRLDGKLTPQVFSVGVSAMLMQVMMLVQQVVSYNTVSSLGGDPQIVLLGAAMRVQAFAFIPLWGMSQGLQPAAGTNYGAKLYGRVRRITNTFILSAMALALVFWIPIELFPKTILGMFLNDSSIIELGVHNFRVMFAIFPILGAMIMSLTFFQSLGMGGKASVMVILRQVGLYIPAVLLLPRWMGVNGVWMASPLTDGLVTLLGAVMLLAEYRKLKSTESGALN